LTAARESADNAGELGGSRLLARMTRETLRKLHSFTGLFPLGAYLLFHSYEHFAVRDGRDAVLARLLRTTSWPVEVAAILLPLLVHAGLGVHLARFDEGLPSSSYASPAFRRLQLVSGIFVMLFLGLHVAGVWLPRALAEDRPGAAYAAMLDQVGHLPGAVLYALGVTAVCLHFGQGLSVYFSRYGVLHLSPREGRFLGAGLGILLWLTFLDELIAYASGAALL
jgi:succinate dehydrogenase / fumarate reductase cytochrome b subunit